MRGFNLIHSHIKVWWKLSLKNIFDPEFLLMKSRNSIICKMKLKLQKQENFQISYKQKDE